MRRRIIPYNPGLKVRAGELRRNSTLSEVMLWNHLKRRQMRGYQFLRQKPLDNFIVDFFCHDLMLAIEIDGSSHDCKIEKDRERQKILESYRVRFLRFSDADVKKNMGGVLRCLEKWIEGFERKHPPAPFKGG